MREVSPVFSAHYRGVGKIFFFLGGIESRKRVNAQRKSRHGCRWRGSLTIFDIHAFFLRDRLRQGGATGVAAQSRIYGKRFGGLLLTGDAAVVKNQGMEIASPAHGRPLATQKCPVSALSRASRSSPVGSREFGESPPLLHNYSRVMHPGPARCEGSFAAFPNQMRSVVCPFWSEEKLPTLHSYGRFRRRGASSASTSATTVEFDRAAIAAIWN